MADSKEFTLAQALLNKTRDGDVDWNQTATPDVFLATLGDIGVRIGIGKSQYGSGSDKVTIELVKPDGATIDSFSDEDFDEDYTRNMEPSIYRQMYDLYNLARRRANGADQAIDYLLDKLR